MKNDLEKLFELRTSLRVHFLENLAKVQVKLTFLHLRCFRNLFLNLYKRNRLFLPWGNTPPVRGGSARKEYLFQAQGIGNLPFRSVKRPKRAKRYFYGCEKVEKTSRFVIFSYSYSAFTAVKWDAKFYNRYVKGVPFQLLIEGI